MAILEVDKSVFSCSLIIIMHALGVKEEKYETTL